MFISLINLRINKCTVLEHCGPQASYLKGKRSHCKKNLKATGLGSLPLCNRCVTCRAQQIWSCCNHTEEVWYVTCALCFNYRISFNWIHSKLLIKPLPSPQHLCWALVLYTDKWRIGRQCQSYSTRPASTPSAQVCPGNDLRATKWAVIKGGHSLVYW
jgi:hypothetical protein